MRSKGRERLVGHLQEEGGGQRGGGGEGGALCAKDMSAGLDSCRSGAERQEWGRRCKACENPSGLYSCRSAHRSGEAACKSGGLVLMYVGA